MWSSRVWFRHPRSFRFSYFRAGAKEEKTFRSAASRTRTANNTAACRRATKAQRSRCVALATATAVLLAVGADPRSNAKNESRDTGTIRVGSVPQPCWKYHTYNIITIFCRFMWREGVQFRNNKTREKIKYVLLYFIDVIVISRARICTR